MIGKFPQAEPLRFDYAEALCALGDRNQAVEHLLDLAREQLNRGAEKAAEQTLARVIELDALSKRFAASTAVDSLSLEVEEGELLVLLGGSGCGKTTTLKMINRLIEPSAGHVRIDGRDTREVPGHELRRGIGYTFQQVGLFPHLTIAENVGVTPTLLGWERRRIDARVDERTTI